MKKLGCGIDMGNKNARICLDINGEEKTLIIPNIVSEIQKTRMNNLNAAMGLMFEKEEDKSLLANIEAEVESNGRNLGKWYYGAKAHEKGEKERGLGEKKYNDDKILAGLLIMIALSNLDLNKPKKKVKTAVGTCLPINEYVDEENHCISKFGEMILGNHKVKFLNSLFNNAEIEIEICDDDVIILPEGATALLNIATDDNGEYLSDYRNRMAERVFMIIDIGGGTIDIVTLYRFEPIPEMCDYINKGIANVEKEVIKDIKNTHKDFDISLAEIDYRIRKNDSKLIYYNEEIDAKDIVTKRFKNLAEEAVLKVRDIIQSTKTDYKTKLAEIIITGGGAVLLGKEIEELIKEKIEINPKITISEECLKDNAKGGKKVINKHLKNKYAQQEAAVSLD